MNKNIWQKLNNILLDLNFTSEEAQRIKEDLVNLIYVDTTAELLKKLPQDIKDQIKATTGELSTIEKAKIYGDSINMNFSEEEIRIQMGKSTGQVLKDYFDTIFKTTEEEKKELLLKELLS